MRTPKIPELPSTHLMLSCEMVWELGARAGITATIKANEAEWQAMVSAVGGLQERIGCGCGGDSGLCVKCSAVNHRAEAMLTSLRAANEKGTTPAIGGEFYSGIEWFACWLLDNVEGETIYEEDLRPWAVRAWEAHLARKEKGGA